MLSSDETRERVQRELAEIRKSGKALGRVLAELRKTVAAVVDWEPASGFSLRRRGPAAESKSRRSTSRAATREPGQKGPATGSRRRRAGRHEPPGDGAAPKLACTPEPVQQSLTVPVVLATAPADVSSPAPASAALAPSPPTSSAAPPVPPIAAPSEGSAAGADAAPPAPDC